VRSLYHYSALLTIRLIVVCTLLFRHAFVTYYKAGAIVEDDGSVKLHALDVKLFNNGGAKFDLTGPVMDRALFHVDNCYNWPNFHSVGT
jgi:xanthine dehydrogenase/oxidase